MIFLKHLLVVSALLFTTLSHSATIISQVDGGSLEAGIYGYQNTLNSNDLNTWTFTLPQDSVISLSLSDVVLTDLGFDLSGLGMNSSFGSITESDAGGILSNIALSKGDYSFHINATSGIGLYVGTIEVAAVPIPHSAWLFGSALLGLCAIGRTRIHHSAA